MLSANFVDLSIFVYKRLGKKVETRHKGASDINFFGKFNLISNSSCPHCTIQFFPIFYIFHLEDLKREAQNRLNSLFWMYQNFGNTTNFLHVFIFIWSISQTKLNCSGRPAIFRSSSVWRNKIYIFF